MRGKKLTHKEFVERLLEINDNVEVIGDYKALKHHIKCRCKLCGNIWNPRAGHLIEGQGCPMCSKCGAKIKTHEQFVNDLLNINSNVQVIGEYCGVKQKIKCRCLKCNNEWETFPNYLLQGNGCPKCRKYGPGMKTHNEFINELLIKNPNVECIDIYHGSNKSTWFKCKICNYEWKTQPYNIINNGTGCPICCKRKSHEQFIDEMHNINSNIDIISKYVVSYSNVKCLCKICGHIWSAKPYNLLSGTGCPKCNMSHGEKIIEKYLNDYSIDYISQYSFDDLLGIGGGLLSYDFYLPQYNMLIEYQGEFHDHTDRLRSEYEFQRQQIHDERKREYAQIHNIKLLEIWYYEFDDVKNILNKAIYNTK